MEFVRDKDLYNRGLDPKKNQLIINEKFKRNISQE